MRFSSAILGFGACFMAGLLMACVPKKPGPTSRAPAVAPSKEIAPPPEVAFKVLPRVRFSQGLALRLTPHGRVKGRLLGISPDGQSWVVEGKKETRLFNPSQPAGVVLGENLYWTHFSEDGSLALVWGKGKTSSLVLVEVATGKILFKRPKGTCAARLAEDGHLVTFDEVETTPTVENFLRPPNPVGQIHHTDLTTKKDTAVGDYIPAGLGRCEASPDGSRFFVSSGGYYFVDGRTGKGRALDSRKRSPELAPDASRYCYVSDKGLRCVRTTDGGEEQVWNSPIGDLVLWSRDGNFALFAWVEGPPGPYNAWAVANFKEQTVLPIQGFFGMSGSLPRVYPGGRFLVSGSRFGLYLFDLQQGKKHFAPHRPLYGHHELPALPQRILAMSDDEGPMFFVDTP